MCVLGVGGASLALHCFAQGFSSCGKWWLLFIAVHRLLIVVASLFAEHGLQGTQASVVTTCRLSSYGSCVLERELSSCGTWD